MALSVFITMGSIAIVQHLDLATAASHPLAFYLTNNEPEVAPAQPPTYLFYFPLYHLFSFCQCSNIIKNEDFDARWLGSNPDPNMMLLCDSWQVTYILHVMRKQISWYSD